MKSERDSIRLQKQQRCYLLVRKLLLVCSIEEIYRNLKELELYAFLLNLLRILSVRVLTIMLVARGQKCVIREECVNV
jgi:hypothetical protein